MRHALILLLPLALLGACGKRQHLEPAAGDALPPKPATAAVQPTAEQLIQPSTQARPNRVDDPQASRPRGEDRFDLPPAG